MPFETGNFVSNLTGTSKPVQYCDRPEIQQATKDIKFLATQTNLSSLEVLGKIRFNGAGKAVGDFLPVPVDSGAQLVKFPMSEIDVNNPLHFVAVVIYNGTQVEDVLIFNASIWAEKHGLFSPFKVFPKTGEFGVKIAKRDKLTEYKFGNVLKDYLR